MPEVTAAAHFPPPPEGEAIIAVFRTARQAHEAGLAILASGHSYRAWPSPGGYAVAVAAAEADFLRGEIEAATQRNRFWPPRRSEFPVRAGQAWGIGIWILGLCGLFAAQQSMPGLTDLGANDSAATVAGNEWWRIITAVTLHADLGHLAGNAAGLALFAYFAGRYLGEGLAFALGLLAAMLSNATNGLLFADETYRSLGASTLVFSELGLITGFPMGCYLRNRLATPLREWLVPLLGGFVLFATMGGGDYPTDVGAHLWGFLFGCALAVVAARWEWQNRVGPRRQQLVLLAATAIPLAAWVWAASQGMGPGIRP